MPDGGQPALTLTVLLTLAVLLVNGWTDAPNAIAGVVATGSMSYRAAAWMAAACNLAGALFFCLMGGQVAKTILNLTDFPNRERPVFAHWQDAFYR